MSELAIYNIKGQSVGKVELDKKVFNGEREVSDSPNDEFSGKLATVTDAVAPNKPGRVEFCGTTWKAESVAALPAGASVRIVGKKNLTLKVEAVES